MLILISAVSALIKIIPQLTFYSPPLSRVFKLIPLLITQILADIKLEKFKNFWHAPLSFGGLAFQLLPYHSRIQLWYDCDYGSGDNREGKDGAQREVASSYIMTGSAAYKNTSEETRERTLLADWVCGYMTCWILGILPYKFIPILASSFPSGVRVFK